MLNFINKQLQIDSITDPRSYWTCLQIAFSINRCYQYNLFPPSYKMSKFNILDEVFNKQNVEVKLT